jgi:hypothetical protein
MGDLTTALPIEIIRKYTQSKEQYLTEEFIDIIKKLYQYEILKPIMDFITTVSQDDRMRFHIAPKAFYELDEGNCVTTQQVIRDGRDGKTQTYKEYIITIKKVTADVVVHEIGHMLEQETKVNLSIGFNKAIVDDIKGSYFSNLSLGAAIQEVMIKQVAPYPPQQRASELFTRYFQLIAMAKEISGRAAAYGYTVIDVYKAFPNVEKWLWEYFYPKLVVLISPQIAMQSQAYIKPIEEIKHNWAKDAVKPMHKHVGGSKWMKTVKSIKDT